MGAVPNAFDDSWSVESLDDGWSLDEETLGLALRPTPEGVSEATAISENESAGWSLAGETAPAPAVRVSNSILNPLSDEEIEAFSRAELAMGTEVDFPVPDDIWFEDLRCIVPRKRAPSVSDSGAEQVALPPVPSQEAASLAFGDEVAVPTPKKQRWWNRLRRSRS